MRSYLSGSTITVPVSGPSAPRTFKEGVENNVVRDGSITSIPTSRKVAGLNKRTKKYLGAICSITRPGQR